MHTSSSELDAFLLALPKAELHLHLEGSVQPATLLTLAKRYGIDLGYTIEADLQGLYQYHDFRHFLELFALIRSVLRRPEDFALTVEELGQQAARQNTRYLEVTFGAAACFQFGLPFDELLDAMARAAETVRLACDVQMRFILAHARGDPEADCWQRAEWCVQGRDRGIVALGLGGYEPGRPASQYDTIIRWVRQQGVPFVPHAGEAVGPEGIWDVLQYDPPRIAHGFRAAEDPALVDYLRAHHIVLDICLTSNVRTGCVSNLESHPLRFLWDAGVPVTLNTDDAPMFNTTLLDEYRLASTHFGFTPAELAQVSLTAIRASLLPAEDRARLLATFQREMELLGV
jgi:adenosine deaminase